MKVTNSNYYSPKSGNVRPLYPEQPLHFPAKGLLISTVDSLHVVLTEEIVRCESDGNYCRIFLRNGNSIMSSKTLKKIHAALENKGFIRVHQSHLVSIHEIQKLNKSELVLRNGEHIPFSRRKREDIVERLMESYTRI